MNVKYTRKLINITSFSDDLLYALIDEYMLKKQTKKSNIKKEKLYMFLLSFDLPSIYMKKYRAIRFVELLPNIRI